MNFEAMSVAELTAIYNKRVPLDKQIKKFSTKSDGVRRVQQLLDQEKPLTVSQCVPKAIAEEVEKPAKGPRRIDRLIEALKQEARSIDWMVETFKTTRKVISNDLCDIRKSHKLVRDSKQHTYKVE